MSIYDSKIQDDWIKDDLIAKIKAADSKYYKESPCLHCGPGNGCDDCRGCEDAKKDVELSKIRRAAYDEYEQRFGVSYQQDSDYDRIVKKEEEYNKWIDYCKKCGGNFDDDCRDCKDWDKKFKVVNSLKWLKEEFKRKYNIDYDEINKNKKIENKMTNEEKRDMIITEGLTIKQWFDYNIRKYGAKKFFDCVNNAWNENVKFQESIKNSILFEIKTKMKPQKIETIEDAAKLLDGNECGDELENEYNINIEKICKDHYWVIVFPYSDDCLELRGFIDDEFGVCSESRFKFIEKGSFYQDEEDDEIYRKAKEDCFVYINDDELTELKNNNYKDACVIEALFCPKDSDLSWQINCKGVDFAKFNILEDDEINSECIIIDLSRFYKK